METSMYYIPNKHHPCDPFDPLDDHDGSPTPQLVGDLTRSLGGLGRTHFRWQGMIKGYGCATNAFSNVIYTYVWVCQKWAWDKRDYYGYLTINQSFMGWEIMVFVAWPRMETKDIPQFLRLVPPWCLCECLFKHVNQGGDSEMFYPETDIMFTFMFGLYYVSLFWQVYPHYCCLPFHVPWSVSLCL